MMLRTFFLFVTATVGVGLLAGGTGGDVVISGQRRVALEIRIDPGTLPGVLGRSYEVKSGDVLSGIAERELGATARWTEIRDWNGLADPDRLRVGSKLVLPPAKDAAGAGWVLVAIPDLELGGVPQPVTAEGPLSHGVYHLSFAFVPGARLAELRTLFSNRDTPREGLAKLDWVVYGPRVDVRRSVSEGDPTRRIRAAYRVSGADSGRPSLTHVEDVALDEDGRPVTRADRTRNYLVLLALSAAGFLGLGAIAWRRRHPVVAPAAA